MKETKSCFRLTSMVIAMSMSMSTLALADGTAGHSHDDKHGAMMGEAADPAAATQVIKVSMSDQMRFDPSTINIKAGDTVRFEIENTGQVKHEFVIGSIEELKEHAELMKKFPGMEHEEPNMTSVEPGQTGVIGWKFTQATEVDFACLIPGHFDAGMVGSIVVE